MHLCVFCHSRSEGRPRKGFIKADNWGLREAQHIDFHYPLSSLSHEISSNGIKAHQRGPEARCNTNNQQQYAAHSDDEHTCTCVCMYACLCVCLCVWLCVSVFRGNENVCVVCLCVCVCVCLFVCLLVCYVLFRWMFRCFIVLKSRKKGCL